MSHKIHYLNFPRGTPPILCHTKMHSFVWHMRSVVDRQTGAKHRRRSERVAHDLDGRLCGASQYSCGTELGTELGT